MTACLFLVGAGPCMQAAEAAERIPETSLRVDAMVRPTEAGIRIRQLLEAVDTRQDPAYERELLYLLASAAGRIPDPPGVSDAQLRLRAMGTAHGDAIATAYSEFLRGEQKMVFGDLDGGLAQILRAADGLRDSRDPRVLGFIHAQLCSAYELAEQFAASKSNCERSVSAWRSTGDALETGRALNLQGLSLLAAGEVRAAIESFNHSRETLASLGNHDLLDMVGDNLAQAYSESGEHAKALALSRASLKSELASGRSIHAMMSRKNIANALLGLGREQEAWTEIQLAESAAWKNGYLHELPPILRASARIATRLGMHEQAARSNQQAIALSRGSDSEYAASILEDLDARLDDREASLRVRQLEQDKQQRDMQLTAARLSADRRQQAFVIALVVAIGFVVTAGLLLMLWRQQRRHARSMQALAHADALTGLANRRAVTLDFDARLKRAQQGGTRFWMLLLDLDHFKRINDEAGHHAGDAVLQRIAGILRERSRANDLVGRLGGEEFVLLFDDLDEADARALAERIRESVMASPSPSPSSSSTPAVTVSGGLARYPDDGQTWDALFARADARLYRAKQAGRNTIVMHDAAA